MPNPTIPMPPQGEEQPMAQEAQQSPQGQEISQEVLDAIRPLFQESYKILYTDGKFDDLMNQVEESGDVVQPVILGVSEMTSAIIRDTGIQEIDVLTTFAVVLIGDILDAIEKSGVQTQAGQFEAIVSGVIQRVLTDNPEFTQSISDNPEVQKIMAQMPEAGAKTVGAAAGGNEAAQGVLQGAEAGKQGVVL